MSESRRKCDGRRLPCRENTMQKGLIPIRKLAAPNIKREHTTWRSWQSDWSTSKGCKCPRKRYTKGERMCGRFVSRLLISHVAETHLQRVLSLASHWRLRTKFSSCSRDQRIGVILVKRNEIYLLNLQPVSSALIVHPCFMLTLQNVSKRVQILSMRDDYTDSSRQIIADIPVSFLFDISDSTYGAVCE